MISYNIKVVLNPIEDIYYENTYEYLSNLIAFAMSKDIELRNLHEQNTYKLYSFCSLYPYQKDGIYKAGNIFQFDIRTIDFKFAIKIKQLFSDVQTKHFKVIMTNIQTNEQRKINKLITLTPSIITTTEKGYKIDDDLELIKKRIIAGAEKKYKKIFDKEISHDFIKSINKINIKPIKIPYKSISFLANKFEIYINQDEISQNLAYILFSTGVLEKNSLGFGFCRAN